MRECEENACAHLPCQNGATCRPLFEEDLPRDRRESHQHQQDKSDNHLRPIRKIGKNLNVVKCKGERCDELGSRDRHGLCPGPGCDYEYVTDYEESGPDDTRMSSSMDHMCICPPQFTGKNCEHSLDPCMAAPCHPTASCDILPEGGYVCKCPPGRTGIHCEICK